MKNRIARKYESAATFVMNHATPIAYTVTALTIAASVAVMVERLTRTADGGHDLSI